MNEETNKGKKRWNVKERIKDEWHCERGFLLDRRRKGKRLLGTISKITKYRKNNIAWSSWINDTTEDTQCSTAHLLLLGQSLIGSCNADRERRKSEIWCVQAARMVTLFFWVLAPCKLVGRRKSFRETYFRAEERDNRQRQNPEEQHRKI